MQWYNLQKEVLVYNHIKYRAKTSRYFVLDDPAIDSYHQWDFKFLRWHSRGYEYPWVMNRIKNRPLSFSVLDAACGVKHPGYLMLADIKTVEHVYALDRDPYLAINGIDNPKVTKIISSLLEHEPMKKYDVITCISSLEHIDEWSEIVHKFFGWLQHGGTLLLTMDIYTGDQPRFKYNCTNRQPGDYLRELRKAGFKVQDYDDFISPASIDAIQSKHTLADENGKLKRDQHNLLKTFRFEAQKW